MAILVLDIDETFWVTKDREASVHPQHILGDSFTAPLLGGQEEIRIINPAQLTKLLNEGQYESIIILTAGGWGAEALALATNHLKEKFSLSEDAEYKLNEALICSPATELNFYVNPNLFQMYGEKYLIDTLAYIQQVPKNIRLENIINFNRSFNKEFVVLDNCPNHINSFNCMEKVTAIWATTNTMPDCEFYNDTLAALKRASAKELKKPKDTIYYLTKRERTLFGNPAIADAVGKEEYLVAKTDLNEPINSEERADLKENSKLESKNESKNNNIGTFQPYVAPAGLFSRRKSPSYAAVVGEKKSDPPMFTMTH